MRGEGPVAESIRKMFKLAVDRYMPEDDGFEFDMTLFNPKAGDAQLSLFLKRGKINIFGIRTSSTFP